MNKKCFKYFVLSLLTLVCSVNIKAEKRWVGGDISLLPLYEEAGAVYKTHQGQPINDVLAFCREEGMNIMRVRVFVNPEDYDGKDADPNACQTIESVIPLCKRIKDSGLALILDFMYSDTWADPAKQWTPKQWLNQTEDQLLQTIYQYTKESLLKLKEAGVVPDFIQTGNEISYGMLWGSHNAAEKDLLKCFMGNSDNWERFGKLLRKAGEACREVCPDAKIILHTERVAAVDVQRNFYNKIKELKVDYDIIGISYYPYWHGSLKALENAITDLDTHFPEKDIMVVETGYPYKWEIPGTSEKVDYPYTDAGQNQFAKDLVEMLLKHDKVTGLLWWWMEYNAYSTNLSGWYNAPLFDSSTGRATSALSTICSFAKDDSGVSEISENSKKGYVKWYNIRGEEVQETAMHQGVIISSEGKKRIR